MAFPDLGVGVARGAGVHHEPVAASKGPRFDTHPSRSTPCFLARLYHRNPAVARLAARSPLIINRAASRGGQRVVGVRHPPPRVAGTSTSPGREGVPRAPRWARGLGRCESWARRRPPGPGPAWRPGVALEGSRPVGAAPSATTSTPARRVPRRQHPVRPAGARPAPAIRYAVTVRGLCKPVPTDSRPRGALPFPWSPALAPGPAGRRSWCGGGRCFALHRCLKRGQEKPRRCGVSGVARSFRSSDFAQVVVPPCHFFSETSTRLFPRSHST
jgi:hypothetical protein